MRRVFPKAGIALCVFMIGMGSEEARAATQDYTEVYASAGTTERDSHLGKFAASAVFGYKLNVLSTGKEFGIGGAVRGGYTFAFPIHAGVYVSGHIGDETHRVFSVAMELGYDIDLGKPILRPQTRFGLLQAKTGEDGTDKFRSPVVGFGVRLLLPSHESFFSAELDGESSIGSAIRGSVAYTVTGVGAYVGGGIVF